MHFSRPIAVREDILAEEDDDVEDQEDDGQRPPCPRWFITHVSPVCQRHRDWTVIATRWFRNAQLRSERTNTEPGRVSELEAIAETPHVHPAVIENVSTRLVVEEGHHL